MNRIHALLIASLLLMAAAPEDPSEMRRQDITAICVINGTRISMRYEGTLYTSSRMPIPGPPTATLSAVQPEMARSLAEMNANAAEDYGKFGAPRLRAPWWVALKTLEPRGERQWAGYGSGDAEMSASGQKFDLQVVCDIWAAGFN
jgi:hypothetical protein